MFSEIGRDKISSTGVRDFRSSPGVGDRPGTYVPVAEALTRRELDVLALLAEGYSTKEIAVQLSISFKTACCHRYRILSKLGARNSVAVVRTAIRQGLIEP